MSRKWEQPWTKSSWINHVPSLIRCSKMGNVQLLAELDDDADVLLE
jgi:hypothetical protein